ncbi:MAG TPA: glycosyltransferase [Actinomycetes bacterium]|nr:glycosyltransferase [Actinomycetes bacterium]
MPEGPLTVALRTSFLLYMLLLLVHSLLQRWYARQDARREREGARSAPPRGYMPTVDVVIPCLDEEPELLDDCFAAVLRRQREYPGAVRVFVVDDGSRRYERLRPVYEHYAGLPGWTVTRRGYAGKRHAQSIVLERGSSEIVVTVDSDTVLEAGALRAITVPLWQPDVGAVTGSIGVSNHSENRLTRIIERQYAFLFGTERAAQSACDAVLCCAGPFAAYRRSVLSLVWDRYLNQRFLGMTCTTGDDIHLTNLVIGAGFRSVYQPRAVSRTQVPSTVRQYLRQQGRWYRSFYRELMWIAPLLPRRHPYLAVDVLARALVPLLLGLAYLLGAVEVTTGHLELLRRDLVPLGAMTLTGAVFVVVRARNVRLAPIALLHAALLMLARLRALLGLYRERWATRRPGVDLQGADSTTGLADREATDEA